MKRFGRAAFGALFLGCAALFVSQPAKADIGIGFSFGYDGGYFADSCDYYDYYDVAPPWGLPPDYCEYPVYYEPVYWGGSWYRGPIYYRWYGGERLYWLNGGWRRDSWRGPRPSIRWTDRGGWHGGHAWGGRFDGNRGWGDGHRNWSGGNNHGWGDGHRNWSDRNDRNWGDRNWSGRGDNNWSGGGSRGRDGNNDGRHRGGGNWSGGRDGNSGFTGGNRGGGNWSGGRDGNFSGGNRGGGDRSGGGWSGNRGGGGWGGGHGGGRGGDGHGGGHR
jgi:hypothetical protein